MTAPRVQVGLERLRSDPEASKRVRGRRIGLLAHPASVDPRSLVHARDVVLEAGADLRVLFGPEHGYGGEAQDMIGVEMARDPDGRPVHSLYGDDESDLSPDPDWLRGLDAVVIDLQDVGSRYYTFVWTAVLVARACSAAGVETIVLDRPNPLGGLVVEGAPQSKELCSFVGLRPVPVRHALTIGEIVMDAARDEKLSGVSVIEMQGWKRSMLYGDTGLPWVLPSPNMPTADTALVYPGGCLLEGTNASEGRGLTRPFEIFGAPWVDGAALKRGIETDAGAGLVARAVTFKPTFHKYAGRICGGVQVHVTDAHRFEPYRAYIAALRAMRKSEQFVWRTEIYEFVDEHPAIDLLTGDARVRAGLDSGASIEELMAIGADRMRDWGDRESRWLYRDQGTSV